MGKIKNKKHDTFIDMTAMSDVTVLLLTFFMLTATFMPKEPVMVTTPQSVSETKIPEANVMTLLINPEGHVFMNLDRAEDKKNVLASIGNQYNVQFTTTDATSFENQTHIGVPIKDMKALLALPLMEQDQYIKTHGGIPTDTIISPKNELAVWIKTAKEVNPDLAIAVKADQKTPYVLVKKVMSTLQDLRENRYNLVTTLKGMPEGF